MPTMSTDGGEAVAGDTVPFEVRIRVGEDEVVSRWDDAGYGGAREWETELGYRIATALRALEVLSLTTIDSGKVFVAIAAEFAPESAP